MSLKVRIDLLFGLLLLLGLAADIGHMALNARARVQAEGAAMTRVTRDFVEAALVGFHGSPDPEDSLRQLVRSLDSLRHVRIAVVHNAADAAAAALAPDEARREAPAWFFNLIHARNDVTILPAAIDGRPFGAVVIASDPADEVNEVWQDVRNLALTGGAIALAALLGASLILGRTLRPLETYSAALGRLSEGDYSVRAQAAGSPEFVDLCAKINLLAEALESLSRANRELIQRLMDVQEDERKKIAHELHDEIGPYLFALRANATVLEAGIRTAGLGTSGTAHCGHSRPDRGAAGPQQEDPAPVAAPCARRAGLVRGAENPGRKLARDRFQRRCRAAAAGRARSAR